jgi:hypothetical protein
MSKWLTGNDLLKKWKIEQFQLFGLVKEEDLQPHDPETGRLVSPPDTQKLIIELKVLQELLIERRRWYERTWPKPPGITPLAIPTAVYLAENKDRIERDKKQIKDYENRIKELKDKIDHQGCSWKNYNLPDSKKDTLKVLKSLRSYIYKPENVAEVEKKIGLGKTRQSQIAKNNCREVAAELWKKHPDMTIADMMKQSEIIEVSKKSDGSFYMGKTLRNWIKDLCPNRSPGRRRRT